MAILVQSNKKPSVTFLSQTGSIVTFNSQYAGLPLKSHTVDVDSVSGVSVINIGSDNKYAGFINFNQIVNGCVNSTTQDGLIITNNGDGSVSISGTAEATGIAYLTNGFSVPRDNSVILFNCVFSSALSENNYLYFGGYGDRYAMTERGCFFKRNEGTNWSNSYALRYYQDTTINTRIWFNTHNLTRMFGQSKSDDIYNMEQQTAGSGVAYFRSLFPNDYYEYNAGTLSTVSAVNGSTNSFFTIPIGQTVNEATYNARTGVMEVTQPSVQTIQLPPCPIDTLQGVNNIFADTGETTVEYIKIGG